MSLQHDEQSPAEVLAEVLNRLPAGKVIVVSTPGGILDGHLTKMYQSQQLESRPWRHVSVSYGAIDALEG